MKELEVHTSGSSPPIDHTTVNHIRGLKSSWGNCCGENIIMNLSKFSCPSMILPNILSLWFCGNIPKKSPHIMLR